MISAFISALLAAVGLFALWYVFVTFAILAAGTNIAQLFK